MLRLGFWQLDRAEQKQQLVEQRQTLSDADRIDLDKLIGSTDLSQMTEQRYRRISVQGQYLETKPLFLDGRVHNSRVGYDVYGLFETRAGHRLLINRGWVYAGSSRDLLPNIAVPDLEQNLTGRLNLLAVAPPLWDESYPAHMGSVWQYFPLQDLTAQYGQNLLPMVLELNPALAKFGLTIEWLDEDDFGVAMHKGYAFQWFSMAAAFVIACLVLLVKSLRRT
jgi:surfeit locus 1 family protein